MGNSIASSSQTVEAAGPAYAADAGDGGGGGDGKTQRLNAKCPTCSKTHKPQYPDPKEKACPPCAEKAYIQEEKQKVMDELVREKAEKWIAEIKAKLCEECKK